MEIDGARCQPDAEWTSLSTRRELLEGAGESVSEGMKHTRKKDTTVIEHHAVTTKAPRLCGQAKSES